MHIMMKTELSYKTTSRTSASYQKDVHGCYSELVCQCETAHVCGHLYDEVKVLAEHTLYTYIYIYMTLFVSLSVRRRFVRIEI